MYYRRCIADSRASLSVLYKQSIRENDADIDSFIECGGSVLKGLNKRLSQKETIALQTYAEIQDFLQKD